MTFQFQTFYREKVRQFYTDMLSDYSQLIENIVINISSLFGVVFQVQYLNEESTWITLSETVADIQDMFRCSQIVNGAEFKRIKIRIVEGCSPAINSNKHSNEDVTTDTSEITKNPKRLRFSEEENDRGGLGSYKTPIELDIQKKQTSRIWKVNFHITKNNMIWFRQNIPLETQEGQNLDQSSAASVIFFKIIGKQTVRMIFVYQRKCAEMFPNTQMKPLSCVK